MRDAFLRVEVDEGSRNHLTIKTHRGLYSVRSNSCARSIIDTMLVGLNGVNGSLDDIDFGGVDEKIQ